jgi:hypothetical protein
MVSALFQAVLICIRWNEKDPENEEESGMLKFNIQKQDDLKRQWRRCTMALFATMIASIIKYITALEQDIDESLKGIRREPIRSLK